MKERLCRVMMECRGAAWRGRCCIQPHLGCTGSGSDWGWHLSITQEVEMAFPGPGEERVWFTEP